MDSLITAAARALAAGDLLGVELVHQFGDPFALHSASSGLKLPTGKAFSIGAAGSSSSTAPADTSQSQQGATQQG